MRILSHKIQICFVAWKKLCGKVLYFFKRTQKKYDQIWKQKILLTNEELKLHQDAKIYYICQIKFLKTLINLLIIRVSW